MKKYTKQISIIISGYNEENYIVKTVAKFYRVLKNSKIKFELLVFDDGSKDNTYHLLLKNFNKIKYIKIYKNKKNMGLGFTLKKGSKYAKYDKVTLFPGDNSYKEEGIKNLIKNLNKDILLIGYRKNYIEVCPFHRKISSIALRILSVFFLKKFLKDVHGPVIYDRKILNKYKLKSLRYNYSIELLYLFLKIKKKYKYVPYTISKQTILNSGAFKLKNIFEILKTIFYLLKKDKFIIS